MIYLSICQCFIILPESHLGLQIPTQSSLTLKSTGILTTGPQHMATQVVHGTTPEGVDPVHYNEFAADPHTIICSSPV